MIQFHTKLILIQPCKIVNIVHWYTSSHFVIDCLLVSPSVWDFRSNHDKTHLPTWRFFVFDHLASLVPWLPLHLADLSVGCSVSIVPQMAPKPQVLTADPGSEWPWHPFPLRTGNISLLADQVSLHLGPVSQPDVEAWHNLHVPFNQGPQLSH